MHSSRMHSSPILKLRVLFTNCVYFVPGLHLSHHGTALCFSMCDVSCVHFVSPHHKLERQGQLFYVFKCFASKHRIGNGQQRLKYYFSILFTIPSTGNLSKTCRDHFRLSVPPQETLVVWPEIVFC